MTTALSLDAVSFAYGDKLVLQQTSLKLERGEVVALLGPSGCGKTTLLNLIAGLSRPTSGTIRIDGALVADAAGAFSPPERRGLGMVFQDYALWPHMSVARNVMFPLQMRGVGRIERARRVARALGRVGLSGFENRSPAQLSGGQQQRAALARAIVAEPTLILFDEPLSNLDRSLRNDLARELSDLVRTLRVTALYVTHDQEEAFSLADRVILMREGSIVQDSTPDWILRRPIDPETASFLNLGALVEAERSGGRWRLRGTDFDLGPACSAGEGTLARLLIPRRATKLTSWREGALEGTLVRRDFRAEGHAYSIRLAPAGPELTALSDQLDALAIGARVAVAIDRSDLVWFNTINEVKEEENVA